MSVSEKKTDVPNPLTFARVLRWIAAVLFAVLLAGYLIYNRTFAKLGFPPFYVGECVLGFATFAALFDFHEAFIRPLKESWIMRCVALFIAYGVLRVGLGARMYGLDAARDGVMCLYALTAFLAPWLFDGFVQWRSFIRGIPARANERVYALFFVIGFSALFAYMHARDIYSGRTPAPSDVKVDFLTVSAAVSYVWFVNAFLALLWCDRKRTQSFFGLGPWVFPLILAAVFAERAGELLLHLPTRAIKPSIFFPFVLPFMKTFQASRPWIRVALVVVVMIGFASCASIYYVEGKAAREKIEALWDSNDSHFSTPEGQRAAHSEKWRIIFWKRCIGETIEKAPLFGLGFGINLTDLLRDTPDWPIFADSQNAAKYGAPNRHPHSAHISVFTRLGLTGLLLWLTILAGTLCTGVQRCLRSPLQEFFIENTILCTWLIFVLAMSFGVVLENPFGGIWFWALTGVIAQHSKTLSETRVTSQPAT